MSTHDSIRPFVIAYLVLLTAIISLRNFLPALLRPDLREDDYAQLIWWTYQFNDAELFPKDVILEFFSLPIFSTYGWQYLCRLFVPFFDAQQFGEILPFVLVLPSTVLVWLLGHHFGRGSLGAAFAVIFFTVVEMRYLRSGLPRSFAVPILLFGMWSLSQHRQGALGLSIFFGALFYPPVAANLVLLTAVVLGLRWYTDKKLPANWLTLLFFVCCAAFTLASAYLGPLPDGIGPRTSLEAALSMPEFFDGGRSAFFSEDIWSFYFTKSSSGLGINPYAALGLLFAIVLTLHYFPRAISIEIWSLAATSIALFVLAHMTLFLMYFPNRFVRYTLPVFYLLFLSSLLPSVVDSLRKMKWMSRIYHSLPERRQCRVFAFVSGIVLLSFFGEATLKIKSALTAPSRFPDMEAAYRFLETLPKETLVAAHPDDADDVPLRARRSVLASRETSLPYHLGYYNKMRERIQAMLIACYADNWSDVDTLYYHFGVDVFIVSKRRYKQGVPPYTGLYYEPFDSSIQRRFVHGLRHGFVLLEPPSERVLFQQGDITIVQVGPSRSL